MKTHKNHEVFKKNGCNGAMGNYLREWNIKEKEIQGLRIVNT